MLTLEEYEKIKYSDDRDIDAIKEFNKMLINKYPWVQPKDYKGEPVGNFEYTELDFLPYGWRVAFGDSMCDEIQSEYELLSEEEKEYFKITEIKEKFGGLRFYIAGGTEKMYDIIDKYEDFSYTVCIDCGKPATWQSMGYILYFCDDCKRKNDSTSNSESTSNYPYFKRIKSNNNNNII